MTISELIGLCHGAAKANGWWEKTRNNGEVKMLIISELGEAIDAHRKGKRANLVVYDEEIERFHKDDFPVIFTDNIKDTLEDEIADTVIRIADYMGGASMIPNTRNAEISTLMKFDKVDTSNIGDWLYHIVRALVHHDGTCEDMEVALVNLFGGCRQLGIDIERHIDLKLSYNRSRGIRHGKSY